MQNILKEKILPKNDEIKKNIFKRDFYSFVEDAGKSYWIFGKHLKYLAREFQNVANGKTRKLMVTMPPRHGKSEVISKRFPAWFLLNNPDKEVLMTSYSGEISYDFSRSARQTFLDYSDLYNLELDNSSKSVGNWKVAGHRGRLVASGVGGAITGRGFHVGIIDDPIKNRQDANSETIRKKTWDWYQSTFRTRGYPDSTQILVQTRWHEDDLAGRLLSEQPGEWKVINLPAFSEIENDVIGRKMSEPLWPERYSAEELTRIKKDIGTFEWLALYQQTPTALSGNLFKREWFQYVETFPEDLRIYQTVDLATSTDFNSDYFALLTFGVDKEYNVYILDLFLGHLEFPDQVKTIQRYYNKWLPLRVGIESVSYQVSMEQWLREKTNIPVIKLKTSTDKVTRALRITPYFENGKIKIMRDIPFKNLLEEQMLQFPNGKHDDIVDVVSYMVDMFSSGKITSGNIDLFGR